MIRSLLLAALLLLSVPSFSQFSGNALDFDGTNDMVVSSTMPALFNSPATNDFTIEAWVNPRGSAFQRIFFAQPSTSNFVSLGPSTGNVIYFYVIRNGTTYSVATTTAITQNAWTHVAARWTSATNAVEVFFNGVQQPTVAGGSSSTGTSGLMVLGSRPGGAQYFNGMLDEVRVWSEARANCEISANYMHSITGVHPTLVVNYDFNQGVPAGNNTGVLTLPDNSGNTYHGTLTNFTLTTATSNWVTSAATLTTQGSPMGGVTLTESASVCNGGSYTFPDGTTQNNITSTAMHTSTFALPSGCDSVINTTVNVNPVYAITDSVWICSGMDYTFPDGTFFTAVTAPMSHVSTLSTVESCDSVITTYLGLYPTYAANDSAMVCSGSSYTFPDGSTDSAIVAPVSHVSMLSTVEGCDSIITTYVGVRATYAQSDSATVCSGDSYTFPDGTTINGITSATSHVSMFTTVEGCDSTITTAVGVNQVDTLVSMLNETLTANASGATYQWLDCGNGYAALPGDTNQVFTATVNGSYALAITENGCTDTSSCFVILSTGIATQQVSLIAVYPNPVSDVLNVRNLSGTAIITDITGAVVRTVYSNSAVTAVNVSDLAAGTYFLKAETEHGTTVLQFVKQ